MFTNLLDDVMEFFVVYSLGDCRYEILCRVSSKVKSVEYPEYEACDVLTCVQAVGPDGKKMSPEEWGELLKEASADNDFWEDALDQFVLIAVCASMNKPAES